MAPHLLSFNPVDIKIDSKTNVRAKRSFKSRLVWPVLGATSFISGLVTATAAGLYLGVLPKELSGVATQTQNQLSGGLNSVLSQISASTEFSTTLFGNTFGQVTSAQNSTASNQMLTPAPLAILQDGPYDFQIFGATNQDFAEADDVALADQNAPTPIFDRDLVLNDGSHRISPEFAVSTGLKERVGFWFDVYSKYDSNKRIIHHSRFPWIVFEVVDVAPIINADEPHHRWLRNEKADKYVKNEVAKNSRRVEIRRSSFQYESLE